jgi:hypothetical protein
MVVTKTLGYILGALGVVGVASWAIPEVNTYIPYLSNATTLLGETPLLILSIVLALVGIFLATKGGGGRGRQKNPEVPIYQGKHIVGYRRHS